MKFKNIIALWAVAAACCLSCVYHNDDNPNVYPEPEPIPTPEPEPIPDRNPEYIKAAYSPNCIMVQPGTSVDIPVMKAYAMWALYREFLGDVEFDGQKAEAVLLWQDTPGLIVNVGMVEGKTEEESALVASTSDKVGNAVVGVRIKGEIRWSWHLWITRYNPDLQQITYGKVYNWDNNDDGITDYVFMDRNLGAVNEGWLIGENTADSLAACGLFYQWGRKDPFPGDSRFRRTNSTDTDYFDSKPIYDSKGNRLDEGTDGGIHLKRTKDLPSDNTLAASIIDPMAFILGESSYNDWLCRDEPVKITKCDTLWCGATASKTPFDPCPEGWQVPHDKNGQFIWNGLDKATTDYSPLGVFPYAGLRYRNGGGCLKNSGFATSVWSGTPATGIGNAYELSIYISPSEKKPVIKKDISCRSDGQSVRCARI